MKGNQEKHKVCFAVIDTEREREREREKEGEKS
jgi:hypothetical protein